MAGSTSPWLAAATAWTRTAPPPTHRSQARGAICARNSKSAAAARRSAHPPPSAEPSAGHGPRKKRSRPPPAWPPPSDAERFRRRWRELQRMAPAIVPPPPEPPYRCPHARMLWSRARAATMQLGAPSWDKCLFAHSYSPLWCACRRCSSLQGLPLSPLDLYWVVVRCPPLALCASVVGVWCSVPSLMQGCRFVICRSRSPLVALLWAWLLGPCARLPWELSIAAYALRLCGLPGPVSQRFVKM